MKIPEAPSRSFTRAPRAWRPGRAGSTATFHAAEAVATIGRLAALLRRFGGQHAAPGVFTAAFGRRAIDWPAFCFDPASGVELVDRLQAGGSTLPLAVLFVADRAGQSKAATSWWVGQTTDAHADLGGERVGIRITVRSRTPDPIRALDRGGYTIAFGDWQLYRPDTPFASPRRGARVVDAVCWINQPWQLQPVHL